MKTSIIICLLFVSIFISSGKRRSHASTSEEQTAMHVIDYGSSIDESYYQMWSDNSWEVSYRFVFIDATEYATILYSESTEYYYSQVGNQIIIYFRHQQSASLYIRTNIFDPHYFAC